MSRKKQPTDKDRLIDELTARARKAGARMTDVRRDVLATILDAQEPESAYGLLERLNRARDKKLSAMSLYRALDFFIDLGIVIKIDKTNRFALCGDMTTPHNHVMIVCDRCGQMKDVHDDDSYTPLKKLAKSYGFQLGPHAVEMHGVCTRCRD